MNFSKMAFKNFQWDNNPEKLTISVSDKLNTSIYPKWKSSVSFVAEQPKIVTGEGVFVGNDAYVKINKLEQVFNEKTAGQLFMPSMSPMKAFFTKLQIIGEPKKDCIRYAFVFTESKEESENLSDNLCSFTIVLPGENLFHIANRTGVSADTIMVFNDYIDMFSALEGDMVKIR